MKVFRFYIGDYDGLNYDQFFSHQEDKTQEEFDADVKFLMKKYFEDYYKSIQKKHWSSPRLEDWVRYSLERISELGYEKYEPVKSCIGAPDYYFMFEKIPKEDSDNLLPLIDKELYKTIRKRENSKRSAELRRLRKEYPEAYENNNSE